MINENNTVMIMVRKRDFGYGGYEFFYGTKDLDGNASIAQPVVFKTLERGCIVTTPLLTLEEDACQVLMNELWIAGIRPSKRLSDPEGSAHLKDEITWLRGTADHLMKKVKS